MGRAVVRGNCVEGQGKGEIGARMREWIEARARASFELNVKFAYV